MTQKYFLSLFQYLTDHIKWITKGSYAKSKELFDLTGETKQYPPEVIEFLESFCLMTVKLEARELALEDTIQKLETAIKIQKDSSLLFIIMVLFIAVFVFLNAAIPTKNVFIASRMIEFCWIVFIGYWIVRKKLPLSEIGLTFNGLKKTLVETFVLSAIAIIVMTWLKWYLTARGILHIPGNFFIWRNFNLDFLSYFLVAPLQELIARGVIQGALQKILGGRYYWFLAPLVTSLIFGIFHLHNSLAMGLLSLPFSMVMGLLYVRHRNIVGISIIHIVVGNFLYILGIWALIAS